MPTTPSLSEHGGAHYQGTRLQASPQKHLLVPRQIAPADRPCGFSACSIPVRCAREPFRQITARAQSGDNSEQPIERTTLESEGESEQHHGTKVAEESLRLLEWPAVCRQVAAFASVSLTASTLVRDGLSIGRSQVRGQHLCQNLCGGCRAKSLRSPNSETDVRCLP